MKCQKGHLPILRGDTQKVMVQTQGGASPGKEVETTVVVIYCNITGCGQIYGVIPYNG